MSGTAPILEARDLSAGYGDLAAVRGVDIQVRPGEVVALMGPNGAGKTTLLRTLAGSLRPLAGEVRWKGTPTTAPLHRRVALGLGLVPESRSVFMELTTAENLRLGRGDPNVALEHFPELRPLLGRRAGLLSGGEQQILTLARTLAGGPEVLLADELSLGLAPLVVRRLMQAVLDAANRGLGALIVEQHAHQALRVASRVYVMRRGAIVHTGSAAELREAPDALLEAYLSEHRFDDAVDVSP
jgi:branched-chain amino acid transport system ATP-binding protein